MEASIIRKSQYEQIADILRDEILKNRFEKNARFYSESQLCKLFNTTHITIRNSLRCLQEEGLIVRIHGKGTFIADSTVKKEATVGIIIPSMAEGIYPELVFAMEETAHNLGYGVLLCNSLNDFDREQEYSQSLISKKVAGVIFDPLLSTTYYEQNIICIKKFIQKHIPVVTIGHLPETENTLDYDSVDCDNIRGTYKLINRLIQLGHKRIGVISEPFNPDVEERIEGYKKALRENGIEFDPGLVKLARLELKEERNPGAVKALLGMEKRPTAIFAVHDILAQFVMKILMSESIRVPEDMAVVGFDDLDFSGDLAVPLTTVRWSRRDQGRIAVEMLIERIESKRREFQHILLPTKLIIRQSCSGKKQPIKKEGMTIH
ncbi:MAG: GntR family transcriptional regulator [Kiritimatiellaeota bacterium]|nr:GntR family transcriptional regulator [Kiritimatiellota bacterium]